MFQNGRWSAGAHPRSKSLFRMYGVTANILSGDPAILAHPGPLVVVSNHPFGILEALVLGGLAEKAGRHPKILASDFLTRIRPLQPSLIAVNSFGTRDARLKNVAALTKAIRYLEAGGTLDCLSRRPRFSFQDLKISRLRSTLVGSGH